MEAAILLYLIIGISNGAAVAGKTETELCFSNILSKLSEISDEHRQKKQMIRYQLLSIRAIYRET